MGFWESRVLIDDFLEFPTSPRHVAGRPRGAGQVVTEIDISRLMTYGCFELGQCLAEPCGLEQGDASRVCFPRRFARFDGVLFL